MLALRPDLLANWLRSLTIDAGRDASPDWELLRRFVQLRDETAFLSLLGRHGPMVLGVCKRLLPDRHAAEDAFQATFLVLLRKGATLARRELVANWLYGVAYRTALQARRSKRGVELVDLEHLCCPKPGPAAAAEQAELVRVLEEEIERLPRKYRRAVVLCYLQGQSYTEAARQLSCPPGTVATWLARARQRMQARLVRRGVAVTAVVLAATLGPAHMAAAVPAKLAEQTVASAGALLAGRIGAISTNVLVLYQGLSRSLVRVKLTLAVVVVVSLSAVGIGLAAGGAYLRNPHRPPEVRWQGQTPTALTRTPQEDRLHAAKAAQPEDEQGTAVKLSGGFSSISLTGGAKVTVKQTGREGVWVKGDKDAVAVSSAGVENDTLYLRSASSDLAPAGIGPKPGFSAGPVAVADSPSARVEFIVEVKDLRSLVVSTGCMDVKQLDTKRLTVTVWGMGELAVAGKAEVLELGVTGSGNFLGEHLKTTRTVVQHTGIGRAVVNASDLLEVTILGSGSVEYVGSPEVRRSVWGLGTVTRKR
jgi:RNA polymerase sigma factor (sigma-70 family)